MDLYQHITDRIIHELEHGNIPWRKPWHCTSGAISRATGKPYSVLNQLLLPQPGEYVTFKQAIEEGHPVKKGEKASMVFFFKFIESKDEETGEKKQIPLLKYYSVFHIDQCEGMKPKFACFATPTPTPTAEPTAVPNPELTLKKTASPNKDVKVSDMITYMVTVKNTGNVTVKNIRLDDSLVDPNIKSFELAPGEEKVITYTYTVTQGDVDAGQIMNAVSVTGTDPSGDPVPQETRIVVPTEEQNPALQVMKTANPNSNVKAGDVITYTVTVKNTGNVTVKNIRLDDSLVDLNIKSFELAPGEEEVITYTYTVTQADVDAGQITNAVTATGTDPSDDPVSQDTRITVTTEDSTAEPTAEPTDEPTATP